MPNELLSLKPLSHPKTLKEMAYASIKEAILTGDMKPNGFYSEPYLAKMLEISRTPIREALQDLASHGFVEVIPKRGYRIRSLKPKEIVDLYDYRLAIELAVVQRIAANMDEHQLIEIGNIFRLDRLAAEKKDMRSFVKINRDFHRYLASLTNNVFFVDSLNKILELIEWAALNVPGRDRRPPNAVKEHETIYFALKEKSPNKALTAMEAHLFKSRELAVEKMA